MHYFRDTSSGTRSVLPAGILSVHCSLGTSFSSNLSLSRRAMLTAELAGQKLLRPDFGYLAQVRADHGDRYHDAVRSCIEGGEAFGIGEEESEGSIETGAKLQRGFMTRVVDALESISI